MIYDAQSLKDKRAVVKSVVTKLKNRYNLSVAEINYLDVWQRTELAIAVVSGSKVTAEKELQRALSLIDQTVEIERTVTTYEWL